MATAASKLKYMPWTTLGGFKQTVADSVDGYWYTPDTNGDLTLAGAAAGNQLCGPPTKRLKVGDAGSLLITGVCQAVGATAITPVGAAICVDTTATGKIRMATPGTDQIHGYLLGPVSTTDGDIVTVVKVA